MPYNNRRKGELYEAKAAEYLVQKGYRILERNYRRRGGELDIVAFKDGLLVVCEVKSRTGFNGGSSLEAVTYRKQMQISKMTAHYLLSHGFGGQTAVRFDVIGFDGQGGLSHIENAFEYCYDR